MTTETGADAEAKQPQENKEPEKEKAKAVSQPGQAAAEPTSPQNQPVRLPAAAGHSTPARKEQVSLSSFLHLGLENIHSVVTDNELNIIDDNLSFKMSFHNLPAYKTHFS